MKHLLSSTLLLLSCFLGNLYAQQTYYSNDFESGITGWTNGNLSNTCQNYSSASSSWALGSTCGGSPITFSSTALGIQNDGIFGPENSWISTPDITTNSLLVSVDFDSWTSNEAGFPCYYDVEYIEITFNNGLTWAPIHGNIPLLHNMTADQTWRHFSLPIVVPLNATFRIRFRMDTGDDYSDLNSFGWFIDNLVVGTVYSFGFTKVDPTCASTNNGKITFENILGGVAPYSYSIDGGATFSSNAQFLNLPKGTYNLVIKDFTNLISASKSVTLTEVTSVMATIVSNNPTTICQGESTQLSAYTESGYTYQWKQNGQNIPGMTSSTYTATQTDNYTVQVSKNGCTATSSPFNLLVNNKPTPTYVSNATCINRNAGSILVSLPNQSSETYQYSIDNGLTYQSSSTFNNLLAAVYTLKVQDIAGCTSLPVQVAVSVLNDQTLPAIVTKNISLTLSPTGSASIDVASIDNGTWDNCGVEGMSISQSLFSTANIGQNNVWLKAWDYNGNVDSALAIVTINANTLPIALAKNITVYLDENSNATIAASDIDNGSSNYIGELNLSTYTFNCSNVGTNEVILTAIGVDGDLAHATSTVTVIDNIAPNVLTKNITVYLNNGTASITPADIDNGSTDACGTVTLSLSTTSFTSSNAGDNMVTLTATDISGNTSQANALVTVVNSPSVVAKNITVYLDQNSNATISPADIDNGSADFVSLSISANTFNCSNIGDNEVTLTAVGYTGESVHATAIVTVVDNLAPNVLTKNITVYLSNGTASITPADIDNGSTDACGTVTLSLSTTSFTSSNAGDNMVTLTAIDISGNTSQANALVTVVNSPSVVAKNITVYLDQNSNATISPADIDNGSADFVSLSISANTFNCSNIGDNEVTLTAVGYTGESVHATAIVTVVDNLAPNVLTKNITVYLSNGTASITPADIDNGSNDACGIASLSLSTTTFNTSNIGNNTVILTATDVNGNVSQTNAVVTILNNPSPVAVAKNITVYLNQNSNATVAASQINNGSTNYVSLSISSGTFTCSSIGANVVTLTAIGTNGDSSKAVATITVKDSIAPRVVTKNITVYLNNGTVSVSAADINNGSNDNCGIASLSVSSNAFTCSNLGQHTLILTAVDMSGNTSSATATVTVKGAYAVPAAMPIVQVEQQGVISWKNIPSTTDGQSSAITNANSSLLSSMANITSVGGNLTNNTCDGMGVYGGNTSGCSLTTDFKNRTINKDQKISIKLTNNTVGIFSMAFSTAYSGRVTITGKRNGVKVVSFTKAMTANVVDTFDFTGSCALRGICVVDEIEYTLAENNYSNYWNNYRRWIGRGHGHKKCYGDYQDEDEDEDDDDEDFDDCTNANSSCGITVKNPILFVKPKLLCGLDAIFSTESIGKFVAMSDTIKTAVSTVNSCGLNSDGNFYSGSPRLTTGAKRLIVGYDKRGCPAAWEVSMQCNIRSIKQGRYANKPQLPLGSNTNKYRFSVTGVDADGKYIMGTRKHRSTGDVTVIRWRVSEYYQRVWVAAYEVVTVNKNGENEDEEVIISQTDESPLSMISEQVKISVYPNPTSSVFTVDVNTPTDEPISIQLFDITGKLVDELVDAPAHQSVSIGSSLKAGVYICLVKQGDTTQTIKISKIN